MRTTFYRHFFLGSYVDWKKSQTFSHVKVTDRRQGHSSEARRVQGHSLGKVVSYPMTSSVD